MVSFLHLEFRIFFFTSYLQGNKILQYKKKKKKIRRQNETQTLRKSDTFCSKVRKCGEDININHKKEKQTLGIKRGMEHKEIQKENSKTN